jgi:hypothetical protein
VDEMLDGGGRTVRFNSRSRIVTCRHAGNNTLQWYSHTLVMTATLRHDSLQAGAHILCHKDGRVRDCEQEREACVVLGRKESTESRKELKAREFDVTVMNQ